ncbi:DUF397 domain-containing protein [Salinifilum ghardaiensis]
MTEVRWRKSSRSGSATKCVEVAFVGGGVRVRDSKDRAGARLAVEQRSWRGFVDALRTGRFDVD